MKTIDRYETEDIFGDLYNVYCIKHGNTVLIAACRQGGHEWIIQSVNRVIPSDSATGRKVINHIMENPCGPAPRS